jgi:hypothetical protein
MTEHKGRVFEILQNAAELLDTLAPLEQKQAMAMLATRYDMKISEKPTINTPRPGYGRKRRYG